MGVSGDASSWDSGFDRGAGLAEDGQRLSVEGDGAVCAIQQVVCREGQLREVPMDWVPQISRPRKIYSSPIRLSLPMSQLRFLCSIHGEGSRFIQRLLKPAKSLAAMSLLTSLGRQ
jgi:hypothetical protein